MKPIRLFLKWQNGQIFFSPELGTCIVLDRDNFICWSAKAETLFKLVDCDEEIGRFTAKTIALMSNPTMGEALSTLRRSDISFPTVNIETM